MHERERVSEKWRRRLSGGKAVWIIYPTRRVINSISHTTCGGTTGIVFASKVSTTTYRGTRINNILVFLPRANESRRCVSDNNNYYIYICLQFISRDGPPPVQLLSLLTSFRRGGAPCAWCIPRIRVSSERTRRTDDDTGRRIPVAAVRDRLGGRERWGSERQTEWVCERDRRRSCARTAATRMSDENKSWRNNNNKNGRSPESLELLLVTDGRQRSSPPPRCPDVSSLR